MEEKPHIQYYKNFVYGIGMLMICLMIYYMITGLCKVI